MVHDSLCRSNILKTNDEELTVVSRMFGIQAQEPQAQCRALLEKYGLRTVILTCGAVGSHVFTPDGMSYVATPHVEVADGVGAGDSFTAQIWKQPGAGSCPPPVLMKHPETFVCNNVRTARRCRSRASRRA